MWSNDDGHMASFASKQLQHRIQRSVHVDEENIPKAAITDFNSTSSTVEVAQKHLFHQNQANDVFLIPALNNRNSTKASCEKKREKKNGDQLI